MSETRTAPAGYRECFIAFLDILGFRELIERSESVPALVDSLSQLTGVSARLKPGMKETSHGPCPMQTRSFSDCVAVFTPTKPGEPFAKNGLSQLLFVVRHIHDKVLDLGACVRGGVTVGKMYWDPAWSRLDDAQCLGQESMLPLTFGPGLVAAYELESKKAVVPRVLVDSSIIRCARKPQSKPMKAYPFGTTGVLADYFKTDVDRVVFLDLLHADVTRSSDEKLISNSDGFTIEWTWNGSRVSKVRQQVRELASRVIRENKADACVRGKHQWLLDYVANAESGTVIGET
ncbi:MAG: hypothetical protein KIS87_12625 [Phycisphaeraceae bacterium]|nr:hypothetical protein [Phycisphaeraceae bacterium]